MIDDRMTTPLNSDAGVAKTFETWRHTSPLTEAERSVLARLFAAGDRLSFHKLWPETDADTEMARGVFTLQDRGWLRMRKYATLEITNRFRTEMPELLDANARQRLISEVTTMVTAREAAVAELKGRCRWPIHVLFVALGERVLGAIPEQDNEARADAHLLFDDLLELLDSSGFDAVDALAGAATTGDRDTAMDLAREGFEGIPYSEVVSVLERHGVAHLLREGDDQTAPLVH